MFKKKLNILLGSMLSLFLIVISLTACKKNTTSMLKETTASSIPTTPAEIKDVSMGEEER